MDKAEASALLQSGLVNADLLEYLMFDDDFIDRLPGCLPIYGPTNMWIFINAVGPDFAWAFMEQVLPEESSPSINETMEVFGEEMQRQINVYHRGSLNSPKRVERYLKTIDWVYGTYKIELAQTLSEHFEIARAARTLKIP